VGSNVDTLAELRDVSQTILEALGREVPPGRYSLLPSIVGRADLALLRGYLAEWRAGLKPFVPLESEVDEETLEGLKSLGYLD
jgi:hypothetical protein